MEGILNYPRALLDQTKMFARVATSVASDTPIPTCPGWTVQHLIRHVGRANRWAAQIISTHSDVSLDPRTVPNGRPPDEPEGVRRWLVESPEVLIAAVGDVDPAVTVASFDGPRPASWWIRRLLHETTVHRADAVLALSEPYVLDPDLAADGVDEWLGRWVDQPRHVVPPLDDGEVINFEATDIDARWTMRRGRTGLHLSREPGVAPLGVQVSGTATALLLTLLRRREAGDAGCRIQGDRGLWTTFLGRTPYAAPGSR